MNVESALTLHDFLKEVGSVIKSSMSQSYWVHAEILRITFRNYCSLELRNNDDSGQVAKARAMIWPKNQQVIEKFERATSAKLESGVKILFKCSVEFHPEYGLSLTIIDIDPSYTLGDMEVRLNAIRTRLEQLGEWGLNKALVSPSEFCRVAVIAPHNAAGLDDFKSQASKLVAHHLCEFDYYEARFQGRDVAASLIQAMANAIEIHRASPYDALVIIRGGGDKAGLYQLNEARIARGVCRCPIPVFVGVGHDRDSTILDEVAHSAFPTPSLVISFIEKCIVGNARSARQHLFMIQKAVKSTLNNAAARIEKRQVNISISAERRLSRSKADVIGFKQDVESESILSLENAKQKSSQNLQRVLNRAGNQVSLIRHSVLQQKTEVERLSKEALPKAKQQVSIAFSDIRANANSRVVFSRQDINHRKGEVSRLSREMIPRAMRDIQRSRQTLVYSASRCLEASKSNLNRTNDHIVSVVPKKIGEAGYAVRSCFQNLTYSANQITSRLKNQLSNDRSRILSESQRTVTKARFEITRLSEQVKLQDPKKILSKGFVLVHSDSGDPITKLAGVEPGDKVDLQFYDGMAKANIEEKND